MAEADIFRVWAPEDVHRYQEQSLDGFGVSTRNKRDILLLGLPKWASPNICFFSEFSLVPGCGVKIGEDRDDRDLLVSFSPSDSVLVYGEEGVRYVAGSVRVMLEILVSYQDMIDEAIARVGDRAFVDNKVPQCLINGFLEAVDKIDEGAISADTFWAAEVERLRNR